MSKLEIRPANRTDISTIYQFIVELAIFEKAQHEVVASQDEIENSLFADDSPASALICSIDSKPIGHAIYFYNYSTWLGKKGLFLEDLYISPTSRGKGAGKEMLQYLAKIAVDNNCGRFEWNVLDWNEPAIAFYRNLGALPQDEWVGYRLSGQPLIELAQG